MVDADRNNAIVQQVLCLRRTNIFTRKHNVATPMNKQRYTCQFNLTVGYSFWDSQTYQLEAWTTLFGSEDNKCQRTREFPRLA